MITSTNSKSVLHACNVEGNRSPDNLQHDEKIDVHQHNSSNLKELEQFQIFRIEDYPLLLIAIDYSSKMKMRFMLFLCAVICAALFACLLYIGSGSLHGLGGAYFVQPAMVYKHRNSIVKMVCAKQNHTMVFSPLHKNVTAQLYVEHSHKFIYCEVPKVGCTNWKRIILLLKDLSEHKLNELKHEKIHEFPFVKLNSFPPAKQQELLSNYTKVMFTRDPLERVVSAYRDKFLHEDNFYYGNTIAKLIKEKLGIKNSATLKITFEEFVRYIVAEKNRDTHWKSMYQLCDPCKISYDVIGKYETLTRDADFVLKTIGAPENITYPIIKHYSKEKRTSEEISKQYLETLPPDLFRQLLNVYSVDFSMFQYDPYKILQPEDLR